jgi:hypothetical protein
MKWTSIPESLAGLSADQLRELAKALKADLATNVDAASTTEDLAEVAQYTAERQRILAKATALDSVAADVDPEPQPEPDPEPAPAPDPEPEPTADPAPEDAAIVPATVPTGLGVVTTPETVPAPSTKPVGKANQWVASDNCPGKDAGEGFEDWTEIAARLQERAQTIGAGSDKKHVVAKSMARFADHAQLSDNAMLNLEMFEPEIMAAMCAPLQPLYDLACANTARRPVKNSLPVFQSPTRGGFSVYPSPSLTDITTGYGQWTADDDADDEAVKEACQTIACATPVDYRIYGVYRCLTVKNLLQMTFPELVEAYLNRLAAAQARLAETLLLEAMGTGAVSIDAPTLGYNASTTITSTLINYLGLYREVERWDDVEMDAWLPRWVGRAMQMDQVRRRRTDGGTNTVPSLSAIEGQFRDAGVTPHWFMDRPSWATPIPQLATAGLLNLFPRNVEMLVAPRGKFAVMDRGELNIGVAPGNLYRDNASNTRNEFTLFFENFEGIIDTTTCPAHIIQINNLCYNGVQIADEAIDCEGQNYAGVGSD